MKIIVHMGQGKTGTSALQESLHAAAPKLRKRRVLYPDFGRGQVTHQFLVALCGDPKRLPKWVVDNLGGPERAVEVARHTWNRTCEEIRRMQPELLVISSEHLIHHLDGAGKAAVAKLLKAHSSDVTPVVYVRHPVDHYRSRLQQFLKHKDGPFPPNGISLRERFVETEAAFGRAPELVVFDRETLHGGDVVCDFATRFLSPWVAPADLPRVTTNVGLSAEALVLMARLRAEAGGTYEAARRVSLLVPLLEDLDRNDPPSRSLTLLPEVAEAALRSATGHRKLVESGLVRIPRLDIDLIDGAQPPDWMKTARAETLFVHDPERLDRLRKAVERQRKDQAPNANDFLLRFLGRKLRS